MMNTQDIIKAGYKHCPICNKPPLFFWIDTSWGIGCCQTGIIACNSERTLYIWNNYVDGKYKKDFPNGLHLTDGCIFEPMAFTEPFNVKQFQHNKRTCSTDSEECWCNPKIEVYPNGNKLVIHNEDN